MLVVTQLTFDVESLRDLNGAQTLGFVAFRNRL